MEELKAAIADQQTIVAQVVLPTGYEHGVLFGLRQALKLMEEA
jgi:hypothetical protein